MPKPSARRFLLSACLLLAPVLAAAQAAVEKVPNVRTITVKAQGGAVSEAFVRGFVAFRAGEPFSREAAASTVRALYATGRFSQAVVLPRLDPATGEVDVEVVVEPRPALLAVTFRVTDGDEELPEGSLGSLELEQIRTGEPLDLTALRQAELKLQTELRKKRPFTVVTSEVTSTPRGAAVLVRIRPGADLRVDHVRLEGAQALDAAKVIDAAELKASSWRWWKFSWLTSGGRLDPEDYRRD